MTDCSHYVVFAAVKSVSEADIDRFIARTAAVRGVTVESMKGYRGIMVSDIVQGPRSEASHEWAARQAYIALGNFMDGGSVAASGYLSLRRIPPGRVRSSFGIGKLAA